MKQLRLIPALLFWLTALPLAASCAAQAAEAHAPKAAQLTPAQQQDVDRIEAYLNALKSVSAGFLQINDSGHLRHGQIAIQRPGKMRVTYDEPDKDFMVADGTFLNLWDDEMQQQSSIPLGSSLAAFILRDPISLSKDVTVTRFVRQPAKLELSLVSNTDPDEGELTLIFEDKPLQLRQWRVLDAQGRLTGVSLENAREGVSFPSSTFTFISPKLGRR